MLYVLRDSADENLPVLRGIALLLALHICCPRTRSGLPNGVLDCWRTVAVGGQPRGRHWRDGPVIWARRRAGAG
eukprot:CAMPEP_0198521866 /NCGR_PEP_ID=MMETSP1462-20131121/21196_1 /TAXON_ID=1333877 /ORGANISM="Brandtodinium nutriculum, Strain RCC3387" /LENGTH=73 /DNA_ID=CAMNT_0044251521 /DNA_START=58 /DNA_END=276 /DNA_ORIENTATION=+